MNAETIIAELNALKITEDEGLPYDIPVEVRSKYPELDAEPVASGLDPDEHRWYVLTTSVYKVAGEHIGVRVVETVKSDNMCTEDCYNVLEFFKMKKVTIESFEREQVTA